MFGVLFPFISLFRNLTEYQNGGIWLIRYKIVIKAERVVTVSEDLMSVLVHFVHKECGNISESYPRDIFVFLSLFIECLAGPIIDAVMAVHLIFPALSPIDIIAIRCTGESTSVDQKVITHRSPAS